ncbi:Putative RxLR effector [Phytophthora palmivora]|uniref:RxLR effector n=1 Tax=Phytophthora palmivora TaxID=4796 RepID=A0A2P4XG15_9STRA|nr:Putative RxLR effector [Phytophthora palmivora]
MRLVEFILVLMIALLAICDGVAISNKKISTITDVTENSRKLLSFDNNIPPKSFNSRKSTSPSATGEERMLTSTSTTALSTKNADGTVTVSKYYNNGLAQKFTRWWNGLFKSTSTRRLRQL